MALLEKYASMLLKDKESDLDDTYSAKMSVLAAEYESKRRELAEDYKKEELALIEKSKEKEREFAEREIKLARRLEKSYEYRIMLQDYQKELREREAALNEREAALEEKNKQFSEQMREAKEELRRLIATAEADEKQRAERFESERVALSKERRSINGKIAMWEKDIKSYKNTISEILEWGRWADRKESAAFKEIIESVEKYQSFSKEFDGFDFEEYTASVLRMQKYENVEVTQKSGDFGADVTAEKDGIKYVFQCKYYTSPVGIDAVQQIYAAKGYYDAHVAIVVTNSVFTKAAQVLARELGVVLWDGERLSKLSKEQSN